MIAFWILAPIMVIAALGILFVRKAVHAALLLAVVMISLAMLYAVLEAPFLFAVQIIVYTGAILMLFLFVLMLVGVDASDSVVETIRGQRVLAILGGLLLGMVLVIGLGQISLGTAVGLEEANADGNIQALANILFSHYVFGVRGHQRAADHRGRRRDGARAPRAADPEGRRSSRGRPSGSRTTPRTARTSVRCRPRASTPGTTRSTPRRCCPTAPRRRRSVSRVLTARGVVRSAPALADDIDGRSRPDSAARRTPAATAGPLPASTTEEDPGARGGDAPA